MTAHTITLPSFRDHVQSTISETSHSSAVRFFAGLWVICAIILTVYGHSAMMGAALLAGIALLSLITAVNTQPNPSAIETNPTERRKVYLQLAVIGGLLALTAFGGMSYHALVPADASIPLWTPFVQMLERVSGNVFGNDNYVSNPVQYFVIPVILLLLLGAKLPALGFSRGHRVLRVTLIWCLIPALALVYQLVTGLGLVVLGQALISNVLQNGFFEEFLFRGALQSRLRRLMSPAWALVLQAIIFGVWHVGLGYTNFGEPGGLITALAGTIVFQAAMGIGFGVIFERSRSLFAPSLFHVLYNTMF